MSSLLLKAEKLDCHTSLTLTKLFVLKEISRAIVRVYIYGDSAFLIHTKMLDRF